MLNGLNKETKQNQNAVITNDGSLCVESAPKYMDLGEIINGDSSGSGYQIAAGALAYSNYFGNMHWQRYLIAIHYRPINSKNAF